MFLKNAQQINIHNHIIMNKINSELYMEKK